MSSPNSLEPSSPALDRASLRPDCGNCFALCCTAFGFTRSADFPINKPAGSPCHNLAEDFSCTIHDSLRPRGFRGCTIFDCFGAGQNVSQGLFAGKSWLQEPDSKEEMFSAFAFARQLHEMLWYGIGRASSTLGLSDDPRDGHGLRSGCHDHQGIPHLGGRIRAVRPASRMALTFLLRDALGATSTPGRLIVGTLAIVLAGALLGLAFVPATPSWLLGAAAGVIVFAGVGPITDGIRQAASLASDFPLYGIGDEHLLANHSLFPLAMVVVVLVAVVIVCSVITGAATGATVISSLALGLLALITRIGNALKGPLPTVLLTPMSTPAGDPMAAVRMAWALDGVLLAALGGAAAALAFESPILLLGVGAGLVGMGLNRWHHRR